MEKNIVTIGIILVIISMMLAVTAFSIDTEEKVELEVVMLPQEKFIQTMEGKYQASISEITESYNSNYESGAYSSVMYAAMEQNTLVVMYEEFINTEDCVAEYDKLLKNIEIDVAVLDVVYGEDCVEVDINTEFWQHATHSISGNVLITTYIGSLSAEEKVPYIRGIVKELGYPTVE